MRFNHLIAILIGAILAIIAGIIGLNFMSQKDALTQARIEQASHITEGALAILKNELDEGKSLDEAKEAIRNFRFNNGNYVFLVDDKFCLVLYPSKPQDEGSCDPKSDSRNGLWDLAKAGGGAYSYSTRGGLRKISYARPVPGQKVYLASGIYLDDLDEKLRQELIQQTLIAIALCAVIGLVLFYFISRLRRDIDRINSGLNAVASGNTKFKEPARASVGEIEQMRQALLVLRDRVAENEALRVQQAEAERGNLEERKRTQDALADGFERDIGGATESLSATVQDMSKNAADMQEVANRTTAQAQNAARLTEQASDYVNSVATAAEQLTASISEISRQTSEATTISGDAVDRAETTNKIVASLEVSANEIGEVVALISEIAEQTNLLALNATIEAARAGEAGKGFAVVASEVKNLASQTAKATDDIRTKIGSVQSETASAVEAIGQIKQVISQINEVGGSLASAVEEQSAATQEIVQNVQAAANGSASVAAEVNNLNESAAQTETYAAKVNEFADKLGDVATDLRQRAGAFLAGVRS